MESNKGVQGTLHKVSGPLTPDVERNRFAEKEISREAVFALMND